MAVYQETLEEVGMPGEVIYYCWKDRLLGRELENELGLPGLELGAHRDRDVKVGLHTLRASDTLEHCSVAILVWSAAAAESFWIRQIWSNAVAKGCEIIPCLTDSCELPSLLANRKHVDLSDMSGAVGQIRERLKQALGTEVASDVKRLGHEIPPALNLRSTPIHDLTHGPIRKMLREFGFYDSMKNERGCGILHSFEVIRKGDERFVIDHATGLMWQQGGSPEPVWPHARALVYVEELRSQAVAGYDDWRLPTLEEGMSIMECEAMNCGLYISPVFADDQPWIWAWDTYPTREGWLVGFSVGYCRYDVGPFGVDGCAPYVRAVRSVTD